jgi:type IV pilus assembly protein PilW
MGLTLIEMMVTLLIGMFLMIGMLSMFAQSRTAYRTNDTVARMQENVRFALAALQPDIRIARNWGLTNENANVNMAAVAVTCPAGGNASPFVLQSQGVQAFDGTYAAVPCPAFGAFRAGSDVLVVRHASGTTTAPANGVIQINSSRTEAVLFSTGVPPIGAVCPPACTYDLQTHVYYVSTQSSLGANVPSLRRKSLVGGVLQDQELIPGVEDFQVQLGVDTDNDNTVDRYVNANNPLLNCVTAANPCEILSAHIWLMFRAEQPETGFTDGKRYDYANRVNYRPGGSFRRALVEKTILLRNAR